MAVATGKGCSAASPGFWRAGVWGTLTFLQRGDLGWTEGSSRQKPCWHQGCHPWGLPKGTRTPAVVEL